MRSNKPILVVDDDPDIRDSIATALKIEGHDVLMAENGKVALDLLTNILNESGELPRCIMLDLMMPVMTGEEFLKALGEAHAELQKIPVIVASANGSLLKNRLPETAREILKKPIDINDLYRIAEQYN